jgi:hypothetical protein
MHDQPIQGEHEEFARLDRAILGLLVSEYRHPWTIDEIEREIGPERIDVPPAIHRLDDAGLLHSWDEFVCPTHAAMRFHEITDDADSEFERGWERRILWLLLMPTSTRNGLSEKELRRELEGKSNQLAVTDALDRLGGAGLVDRDDVLVAASTAAARFDQIMSL